MTRLSLEHLWLDIVGGIVGLDIVAAVARANSDTHPQSRRSFTENHTFPCHSLSSRVPAWPGERQVVMMASRTPAELTLGPDLEPLTQALRQRLLDAGGHRHLGHSHTVPATRSSEQRRSGTKLSFPTQYCASGWHRAFWQRAFWRREFGSGRLARSSSFTSVELRPLDAREVGQRIVIEPLVCGQVDRNYAQ